MNESLPVVVVGAGPVGLAAAAHLLERGVEPLVLEAGATAGASVRQWHHVRLFSPWSELVDQASARILARTGWERPDPAAYPTGRQWADAYLAPLAAALGSRVRLRTRVVGVSRRGRDRIVDAGRDREPFVVHIASANGEERITARAVIDASGTWSAPNPVGSDGLPALGEAAAGRQIAYRVPDLTDASVQPRYAGQHVAVVGAGHSALTALLVLTELPDTRLSWVIRRGRVGNAYGGGDADQLPARGALGQRARTLVESGRIEIITGFRTTAVQQAEQGLVLVADDERRIGPVAEVIALTGFRPDLTWLSEVRLELDPALQAPVELAPLIDPNVHSCGTVYPHGAVELAHPEPGFYLAGTKSYGRAPTFLALTGYEQVRSIAAELAGDHDAARRVELALPETGVCSGTGLLDQPQIVDTAGCCTARPTALPAAAAR